MSPAVIALVVTVAGVSAAASAVTGFGFALLAVPPLAALLGARTAVVLVTALGLVTSAVLAARGWDLVRWPEAKRLFVGTLLGMPFGLVLLLAVQEDTLRLVIAAAVLVFTVLLALRVELPVHRTSAQVAAGAVSGALATSTSTNGPPLVITLQGQGIEPGAFRATLSVLFLASGAIALALLGVGGAIDATAMAAWLVALPAVLTGFFLGNRLFHRVAPELFRRLVLGGLVLSAVLSVVTALA